MGASNYLLQRSQGEKKEMIKHRLCRSPLPWCLQILLGFHLFFFTFCNSSLCGLLWFLIPSIQKAYIKPQNCVGLFPNEQLSKKKKRKIWQIDNFLKSLHNLTLWLILRPAPNISYSCKNQIGNTFCFHTVCLPGLIPTRICCHPCRNKKCSCSL